MLLILAETNIAPAEITGIFAPLLQYGFAGFSFILLAFIFWLVVRLLRVLSETNMVVARNTDAIAQLTRQSVDHVELTRELHMHVVRLPCQRRAVE